MVTFVVSTQRSSRLKRFAIPSESFTTDNLMPRVIFLNRFFHPDHSATSRMVSDLAFELAAAGKEVHVITSRQLYDAPEAVPPAYEITHGVHIHRVGTTSLVDQGC